MRIQISVHVSARAAKAVAERIGRDRTRAFMRDELTSAAQRVAHSWEPKPRERSEESSSEPKPRGKARKKSTKKTNKRTSRGRSTK